MWGRIYISTVPSAKIICRSGGVANWVRDLRSLMYCLYLTLCLIDVFRAVLLHVGAVGRDVWSTYLAGGLDSGILLLLL